MLYLEKDGKWVRANEVMNKEPKTVEAGLADTDWNFKKCIKHKFNCYRCNDKECRAYKFMHDIGSLRAFHDACDASGRKCRECPLIDCPNKREIAAYLVCNLDEEACDKCKKAWFCSLKKVKRGNTHPLNPCRNSKDHDCTTCPESNCPFKSENWWKTGFQEYMDERLEKFRKRIDSIEEKD